MIVELLLSAAPAAILGVMTSRVLFSNFIKDKEPEVRSIPPTQSKSPYSELVQLVSALLIEDKEAWKDSIVGREERLKRLSSSQYISSIPPNPYGYPITKTWEHPVGIKVDRTTYMGYSSLEPTIILYMGNEKVNVSSKERDYLNQILYKREKLLEQERVNEVTEKAATAVLEYLARKNSARIHSTNNGEGYRAVSYTEKPAITAGVGGKSKVLPSPPGLRSSPGWL